MNPEKDLYAFFFFAGKNLGLRKGKNTLSKFEIFATFQGLDKIWLSTGTCDHFEAISTRRQLSPSPPSPLTLSLLRRSFCPPYPRTTLFGRLARGVRIFGTSAAMILRWGPPPSPLGAWVRIGKQLGRIFGSSRKKARDTRWRATTSSPPPSGAQFSLTSFWQKII